MTSIGKYGELKVSARAGDWRSAAVVPFARLYSQWSASPSCCTASWACAAHSRKEHALANSSFPAQVVSEPALRLPLSSVFLVLVGEHGRLVDGGNT